jgi:hypothetical protein
MYGIPLLSRQDMQLDSDFAKQCLQCISSCAERLHSSSDTVMYGVTFPSPKPTTFVAAREVSS